MSLKTDINCSWLYTLPQCLLSPLPLQRRQRCPNASGWWCLPSRRVLSKPDVFSVSSLNYFSTKFGQWPYWPAATRKVLDIPLADLMRARLHRQHHFWWLQCGLNMTLFWVLISYVPMCSSPLLNVITITLLWISQVLEGDFKQMFAMMPQQFSLISLTLSNELRLRDESGFLSSFNKRGRGRWGMWAVFFKIDWTPSIINPLKTDRVWHWFKGKSFQTRIQ